MSSVSIRNLCIRFGATEVIKDLDLDVVEGEFLVLLGPSGCGKSTLLHGIAGLIETAAGTVSIGGQDMTDADPTDRNIGMVFQSYALYPTMTVERNMSFGLRVKGTPRAEIERRVKHAAELLQLEPLLSRKPAQLSGGQRQRVAIGRALVREAGVFLFDEPLSNLDAKLRTELRRELKLLHKRLGSTMIYVTHDQVEAMTLASRIVVMRNGSIQQIGAPAEVYAKPANLFVAGFLGAPGMNFMKGTIARSDAGLRFESANLELDLSGYPFAEVPRDGLQVILGVRPENVQMDDSGRYEADLTLVEPMGNHQVVWLDCGGAALASLANDTRIFRSDESIRFGIDSTKVSLFDAGSDARL
jgi:multiple sugar transport system ATP-binding protein